MSTANNLRRVSSNEQRLLSRKECLYDLTYSGGVPSRVELKKQISELEKTGTELIAIRKINTGFGFGKAKVLVYLYSDKKAAESIEQAYIAKRELPKEKKTKEEKPAKEKKEEKLAEGKEAAKEEKSGEAKKEGEEKSADSQSSDKPAAGEKKEQEKPVEKKSEDKKQGEQ